MSRLEIKPSEELAYWIGVVQSDGCYYKQKEKLESYLNSKGLINQLVTFRFHLRLLCSFTI